LAIEQNKQSVAKQQQFDFEQTREREQQESRRVQDYLATFSDVDREALIDSALAAANDMVRSFAVKYRQNPKADTAEIMYQIALRCHVLPLLPELEAVEAARGHCRKCDWFQRQ
jgi:hypothetical protein